MEAAGASCGLRDPITATTRLFTAAQVNSYHHQGFIVAKGLFDENEADAMLQRAQKGAVVDNAYGVLDASGKTTKLSLFNTPGVNIFGAVSRTARILDNVELLLSGPSHGEET